MIVPRVCIAALVLMQAVDSFVIVQEPGMKETCVKLVNKS